MEERYYIRSNREAGEGRFDIQLLPRTAQYPGILIEIKAAAKKEHPDLKALAKSAIKQINDQRYDTEMKAQGITTIIKYGAAFSGKDVEVLME